MGTSIQTKGEQHMLTYEGLSRKSHFRRVWIEDINLACQRAADLVVRSYVHTAESCGWHQYLGGQRAGPPATVTGLQVLWYSGRDFEGASAAKQSLYRDQFKAEQPNVDGGWTIRSIARYPIVESTAWVMYGLQLIGEPKNEAIQRGLQWLVGNQNDDGGWGSVQSATSRVYVTYWVSAALELSQLYPETLFRANSWLKASQNRDGGWGEVSGRESSAVHTACGILSLLNCGESPTSGPVREGVQWLVDHCRPDLLWEWSQRQEEYDIILGPDQWDRVRLRHFPTQWAAIALLEASGGIFSPAVFDAVAWILATQQPAGHWLHPMTTDRISIWGIHDSVWALKRFMEGFGRAAEVGYVELYKDIVVFVHEGTQPSFRRLLWLETVVSIRHWAANYWSVSIVIFYLLVIYPLVKWVGLSLKDTLLGIILPLLLVFYQYFLSKQLESRRR